jgi:hypothetical protein
MHNAVDQGESGLGAPPSVWPAYVAAVASVVLCVLLLISVLAMVIDQFAKLASVSPRSAPSLVAIDEIADGQASTVKEDVSSKRKIVSDVVSVKNDDIQDLERQLQMMTEKNNSLRQELERKKASMIVQMAAPKFKKSEELVATNIVFRVESGVYSLDDQSERVLMDVVKQHAAYSSQWRLESGVADLDEIATREVYAFITQIYSKLIDLGVLKSDIKLLLNKHKKQYELHDANARSRDGVMIIVLQVRHAESS